MSIENRTFVRTSGDRKEMWRTWLEGERGSPRLLKRRVPEKLLQKETLTGACRNRSRDALDEALAVVKPRENTCCCF